MGRAWEMHGKSLGNAWEVSGKCMGSVWEALPIFFPTIISFGFALGHSCANFGLVYVGCCCLFVFLFLCFEDEVSVLLQGNE